MKIKGEVRSAQLAGKIEEDKIGERGSGHGTAKFWEGRFGGGCKKNWRKINLGRGEVGLTSRKGLGEKSPLPQCASRPRGASRRRGGALRAKRGASARPAVAGRAPGTVECDACGCVYY
jgi:hypothetical protein